MTTELDLRSRHLGPELADTIREARRLVGWTQRDLAARAQTSQATVWRMETGKADHLDVVVVERVLDALGMRPKLQLTGRHVDDRRSQVDLVHARLNAHVERRLRRAGWQTATEVQIGYPDPRGWIDTLAWREGDAALLVEETKTDLPDLGGVQRSLAFYERAAWKAGQSLGWYARTVHVLLVCLDTTSMRTRLANNRQGLSTAFPGLVDDLAAWLLDPRCPRPRGRTIALADPGSRSRLWLRAARQESRVPAPYADYADAARRFARRRG